MRWSEVYDSDADEVQRLQDEVEALRTKVEAVRELAKRFPAYIYTSELRKAIGDPKPES